MGCAVADDRGRWRVGPLMLLLVGRGRGGRGCGGGEHRRGGRGQRRRRGRPRRRVARRDDRGQSAGPAQPVDGRVAGVLVRVARRRHFVVVLVLVGAGERRVFARTRQRRGGAVERARAPMPGFGLLAPRPLFLLRPFHGVLLPVVDIVRLRRARALLSLSRAGARARERGRREGGESNDGRRSREGFARWFSSAGEEEVFTLLLMSLF